MNIYLINSKEDRIKELNQNRNNIIKITLFNGILSTFLKKGNIIYSENKNVILDFCEKFLKIPYLYGEINNILEFENHYAKIKKYEIPILMYHQFMEKKSDSGKAKIFVTKKQFELHLKILKFLGYQTITFKDLKKIGLQNRFLKKYIILTVDDGYEDNYKILFPLLKKYNMKAVIFLVSGLKNNQWTINSFGEKEFKLLNDIEVKEMLNSGLIEFGGHTLTHLDFHKATDKEAEYEIEEDKKITEKRLGEEIITFAYPFGHRKDSTKEIVRKKGYSFAVSTDTGEGIFTKDLYDIRRIAIDRTSLLDFFRKISPKYAQYKAKKYNKK
ncbi:polysaccharide deacetylase family protein [Fusobacterium perfoetens]|uniref:polysaccharide deacetylase family protein n=1 Tax=Fusobacterium perfoetens TaxID=852 RepID=UPI000A73FA17|nr:polysaccharide deacetylase family protein [Fusobacterium perfoetens]